MKEVIIGDKNESHLRGEISGLQCGEAYLRRLWVSTKQRRQGLARSYLTQFIAIASLSGSHGISTVINPDPGEDEVTIKLVLEKFGFKYIEKMNDQDFYYKTL